MALTDSRIRNVLVIDDDPPLLNAVSTILKEAGFEVYGAGSGRQATALIEQNPVDLLITDLGLPEEDGIEIIRRLRKNRPGLKIIAISGTFGPDLLKVAQHLGADATLGKPMRARDLLDCIHGLDAGKQDAAS